MNLAHKLRLLLKLILKCLVRSSDKKLRTKEKREDSDTLWRRRRLAKRRRSKGRKRISLSMKA